jgi:hypothetical protein
MKILLKVLLKIILWIFILLLTLLVAHLITKAIVNIFNCHENYYIIERVVTIASLAIYSFIMVKNVGFKRAQKNSQQK